MDIKERLESMKARYNESSELSSSDKSFIDSYYERVTTKQFNKRACNQCYHDAFIEMYLYVQKNGVRDMGKFILKREVVRVVNNTPYSRSNMTDEVALIMLGKFPQRIVDFEQFPDNWEELVNGETKEETPKVKKSKKSKTEE